MTIKNTVLEFQLGNKFEEYKAHMNAEEQQKMFKGIGIKTFYIAKSLYYTKSATVIFPGPVNILFDIFANPETKTIVEASGHIYKDTKITRLVS